ALFYLWFEPHAPKVSWTWTVLVLVAWVGFALHVRGRVVHPLHTVANLLGALREGDFSIRARTQRAGPAPGLLLDEVNAFGDTLRAQRLGAVEANALLAKVMSEIDAAVFAFDDARRLRLVNRAGERLLRRPAERVLGESAEDLGLGALLEGE